MSSPVDEVNGWNSTTKIKDVIDCALGFCNIGGTPK